MMPGFSEFAVSDLCILGQISISLLCVFIFFLLCPPRCFFPLQCILNPVNVV